TVNSSLRVDKQSQMCDSTDKNCSRFTGYCSLKRKAAFTLAEVLITLGIIGVVAALTLPTLISNYQKRVYVNQLKKSISTLSQGFTLMMGQDGVTELKDTDAFSGIEGEGSCDHMNFLTDNCRSVREGLQRVFSGIQFAPCDGPYYKYLSGSFANTRPTSYTCINFPDGLQIMYYKFYKTPSCYGVYLKPPLGCVGEAIDIDINGPKNPNTFGRDVYRVLLADNGSVYVYGSQVASKILRYNPDYYYWQTTRDEFFKCTTSGFGYGGGCGGRVLEEDAMNY
ncbi:MAG: type II secretion system protein, partial [Candidatus Gastranaerophilaceae bacterium]|nr:type II secretion system protein [Candidatus Gastranaerophilaceae bacterium]